MCCLVVSFWFGLVWFGSVLFCQLLLLCFLVLVQLGVQEGKSRHVLCQEFWNYGGFSQTPSGKLGRSHMLSESAMGLWTFCVQEGRLSETAISFWFCFHGNSILGLSIAFYLWFLSYGVCSFSGCILSVVFFLCISFFRSLRWNSHRVPNWVWFSVISRISTMIQRICPSKLTIHPLQECMDHL